MAVKQKINISFKEKIFFICLVLICLMGFLPFKKSDKKSNKKSDKDMTYFKRNRLMQQTCNKYGIPVEFNSNFEDNRNNLNKYQLQWQEFEAKSENYDLTPLIYNEKHSLCYCWTRKVASTSWKVLFYKLIGEKMEPKKAHKADRQFMLKKTKLKSIFEDNTTLRFFFTRHPYDRIVSAYVQKFKIGDKKHWIYKKFVPKIFAASSMRNFTKRPTFKQFVRYVISLRNIGDFDDHWIPQWLHCNVCQWSFHVPGHLETIQQDSKFILQSTSIDLSMPWDNLSQNLTKRHIDTGHAVEETIPKSVTKTYLEELDETELEELQKLYLLDFEMFGYSPDIYYD